MLVERVQKLLGSGSPLVAAIENFAHRPEQVRMAEEIARSLEGDYDLVVEAGTGTGKTLAYLLPLMASGRRAVISTGTKTLQDQLYHRDLPALGKAIGRPSRVALLKGRANYVCLHRLDQAERDLIGTPAGRDAVNIVSNWAGRTRTGEIGEIDGIDEGDPVWQSVTSTADNCLGSDCRFIDDCHVIKARQKALRADIVIVNHHLLMADLSLKEDGFGELLPGFETVVIDEAHQFPETAQAFFNVTVTSRQLRELVDDLRAESIASDPGGGPHEESCREIGSAVAAAIARLADLDRNVALDLAPAEFLATIGDLVPALGQLAGEGEYAASDPPGLRKCRERAQGVCAALETILDADSEPGLRWVQKQRGGFTLNFAPVDVSASLSRVLRANSCNWVMTSATLAVNGDFGHFTSRLGMEDAECLVIDSPFDYADRSIVYVPDGLPAPSAHNYTKAVVDAVLPVLRLTGGRAFFLFTSHRALRLAAELIGRDSGFELLVQGTAPRSRLLDHFVTQERAVLLGTASFWEGVDIRGEALVVVAIDKLPFASPDDPMLQVRLARIRERGGNPFGEYQLPQAVLALKQGVGRLMRDYDDYGVIVLCDPRLYSRSYGRVFRQSLPAAPVARELAAVESFIARMEESD